MTANCVTFFHPACEELRPLTREDPTAFAPPPAFGPFRVLHQVGVGALGPVFRTYEPTRDRLIAVKVFRLDITPEQAQSLADELSRAADASLFHPSIVEPIAAGVQGTVAYRAEEYVAAESLDVAMRHYAPAPITKVLPFVTQLAGAIDFARAAGVAHGGLHPRDVFVTPDEARMAGFGIVEALERVGVRAPVRRPYTAPERIDGGAWSTTADIFSLAAIAFEMLTARRPAGTGADIGPLSGGDTGRHEQAMHAVFARAMDPDPAKRYQSALAFASALEAASRGVAAPEEAPAAPAIVATGPIGLVERAPVAAADRAELDEQEDEDGAPAAAAPPAVVPVVAERVVQPEGEEAFAEPERVEDVDLERDEDEAYHALLEVERREREAVEAEREPDAQRFSDADAADLPLRSDAAPIAVDADTARDPEERPSARPVYQPATYSTSELAAAAAASRAERGRAAELHAGEDHSANAVAYEPRESREGPRMLPLALTLLAGLLIGFAAGYFVRGREIAPPQQATVTGDPRTAAGARSGPPQPAGREWSEQAVAPAGSSGTRGAQPPSAPPPVPGESPDRAAAAAAAPQPAPAAPTRGRLLVESTPSRAGVTLNGRWRGRTPLTIDDLPFGSYTVRIVQPGYTVARQQVALSRAQSTRALSFRLEQEGGARTAAPPPESARTARTAAPPADPEPGSDRSNGVLFVDSRPRGAQVFVDGRLVGTTPLRLPEVAIGSHVVRLELRGHQRWSTSASVSATRETRVTGSLDPIQ